MKEEGAAVRRLLDGVLLVGYRVGRWTVVVAVTNLVGVSYHHQLV